MQEEIFRILQKYTGHKSVKLCQRGNAAIFAAFVIAKKAGKTHILIPDQGGWMSYRTYPPLLDLKVTVLATDYGVVKDVKQIDDRSALIIPTFAGYYAEQPYIYEICKKKDCLLIEDISGSIGLRPRKADIKVGSFGSWKTVDVGHGGFISCRDELFQMGREIFSTFGFPETKYTALRKKLNEAPKKLQAYYRINKKIKKDFNTNILHSTRKGINVIVKYDNEADKTHIINYCKKNNYEYVVCPKEYRVQAKAISIEVKRWENSGGS